MAKSGDSSLWRELLSVGLYKRNQGRLARQLTAAGLGVLVVTGAYILSQGPLAGFATGIRTGVPLGICALAGWLIFRLINYPPFAEFLISVEGEMGKVSWPSRQEWWRATIVVLTTMLFLAIVLFAYDSFWLWSLSKIGILRSV
ncbi:MAG: preprotein translocase subunit SecE [Planctomycetaceae bacterium]